jgi:hypothetical protein
MRRPTEYFVIMATDVFGPDPGNEMNAWLNVSGEINAFDVDFTRPELWSSTMANASFFAEQDARKIWELLQLRVDHVHCQVVDFSPVFIFGFSPETLALVKFTTDGSWMVKSYLMDTYLFRDR